MTVSTLRAFLESLAGPVRAAGGPKAATDLAAAAAALGPFAEMKVDDFAAFLRTAEHYRRTGEVPVAAAKPKRSAAKADPEKVKTAALTVTDLYERAISEGVDYAAIEAELKQIEKSLSAAEAKSLAAEVHIATKPKSKKAAFEAIKARIFDRKQSYERTAF